MIFVAWKRAAKARAALKKIYSGKNKEGFPLGLQARFVPFAGDTRFCKTSTSGESIDSLELKQKAFVENSKTDVCEVINDLDYIHPDLGVSLRHVITSMRSSRNPDKTLFCGVDNAWRGNDVIFMFHKDQEEEARMMIPALPLVLEDLLNDKIWDWFADEARLNVEGFRWDPNRGLVCDDEEARNEESVKWLGIEGLADVETPNPNVNNQEIVTFDIVMDKGSKNQFGDNNTIKTHMLHQIKQVSGEPMYDDSSIITKSTMWGGENVSKDTSSLTPDSIAKQLEKADEETKKNFLESQLKSASPETKKKILEWAKESLTPAEDDGSEIAIDGNAQDSESKGSSDSSSDESQENDSRKDDDPLDEDESQNKDSEDDSVEAILADMGNSINISNQEGMVVDEVLIEDDDDEAGSLESLEFKDNKIGTRKINDKMGKSDPKAQNQDIPIKKTAMDMVANVARNLKERFRPDNSNNNQEVVPMDETDTAETAGDQQVNEESGTKRSRSDRKGPTTDMDIGDIEPSSSSEAEQANKVRKENEEQKE